MKAALVITVIVAALVFAVEWPLLGIERAMELAPYALLGGAIGSVGRHLLRRKANP